MICQISRISEDILRMLSAAGFAECSIFPEVIKDYCKCTFRQRLIFRNGRMTEDVRQRSIFLGGYSALDVRRFAKVTK